MSFGPKLSMLRTARRARRLGAAATPLKRRLDAIRADRCALLGVKNKGAVWTRPELRVAIAFRGWTDAGELRHDVLP